MVYCNLLQVKAMRSGPMNWHLEFRKKAIKFVCGNTFWVNVVIVVTVSSFFFFTRAWLTCLAHRVCLPCFLGHCVLFLYFSSLFVFLSITLRVFTLSQPHYAAKLDINHNVWTTLKLCIKQRFISYLVFSWNSSFVKLLCPLKRIQVLFIGSWDYCYDAITIPFGKFVPYWLL